MSSDYDSEYRKMLRERHKIVDATSKKREEPKQEGYKTKHSVVNKLPMHLGTFDPRKKRRKQGDLNEEDKSDLATYFGSSGEEKFQKY
jgi:hypothetical protein